MATTRSTHDLCTVPQELAHLLFVKAEKATPNLVQYAFRVLETAKLGLHTNAPLNDEDGSTLTARRDSPVGNGNAALRYTSEGRKVSLAHERKYGALAKRRYHWMIASKKEV